MMVREAFFAIVYEPQHNLSLALVVNARRDHPNLIRPAAEIFRVIALWHGMSDLLEA
jgi:hypothetical protein